jgi:hypothetical protein
MQRERLESSNYQIGYGYSVKKIKTGYGYGSGHPK